jgi:integrase
MKSISLIQQNSDCINSSPLIINFGLKDQRVRIFSGNSEEYCTEISYNPLVQEICIRFIQSTTLIANEEKIYVDKEPDKKTFWELYDQYITLKKSEYSLGFIKQIKSTRNNLKRFLEERNINFEDIDIQFLESFREYYIEKLGNTRNSFAGNIKRIKFFLHYALKNGWSKNEKFKQFKAPERYGKVEYLTWDELMKLYSIDYKKGNLNQVRDCFVFQSLIGCRYQDLKMLKKENFENGILKFTTQKTCTQIEIPLMGIQKNIIQNNSDNNTNLLLPVINNARYNKLLKQIGKLAGLERKVEGKDENGKKGILPFFKIMSSHMARRNFVGNAINKFNIRTEVIQSITGHSKNSKSFGRYYDIDMVSKKRAVVLMTNT